MITYQKLTKLFLPSAAELVYRTFKKNKELDYNKVINEFENTDTDCFIAIDNDLVVGFVAVNIFKPLFTENCKAHISWIAVTENYRGLGISKVLLQMVEQHCKSKGCRYMDLSSRISEERKIAHLLYESFGFKSDTQKYFIKHFLQKVTDNAVDDSSHSIKAFKVNA